MSKLKIRDFIYLDAERLKSILAQVDESLLEKVDEAESATGSAEASADIQIPLLAKLGGAGSYVATRQVTETRTLHDAIYNFVERRLVEEDALFVLSEELDSAAWLDDSARADVNDIAFVLVRGRPLLNDFAYMKGFLSRFNEVAGAIGRLWAYQKLDALTEQQGKALLKEAGGALQQRKDMMADLDTTLETFVRNDLVVKILPFDHQPDARAVSNLDNAEALRIPTSSLTYRFGSAPRGRWTLFGQIASVPLSDDTPFKFGGLLGAEIEKSVQGLFDVLRQLEPMASTVVYPEICITPIALYRE